MFKRFFSKSAQTEITPRSDWSSIQDLLMLLVKQRMDENVISQNMKIAWQQHHGGSLEGFKGYSPLLLSTFHPQADLCAYPVIDRPDSMLFISEDDVERWGVSEDEVWNLAKRHLYERTYTKLKGVQTMVDPTNNLVVAIIETNDGYDASCIFVRPFLSTILEEGFKNNDNVWVAFPDRDIFIFYRDDDPNAVFYATHNMKAARKKYTHPLPCWGYRLGQNGDLVAGKNLERLLID